MRTPTARAAGIAELEIVVDSHEQYPYRFAGQQVREVPRRYHAATTGWSWKGGWSRRWDVSCLTWWPA